MNNNTYVYQISNKIIEVDIHPTNRASEAIIERIEEDLVISEEENFNEIYEEQWDYLKWKPDNSYFFSAFDEGQYLGGVLLFLNTERIIHTPSPGFQGIAKSIYGLYFPFKLNEVLIPAIINFLKSLGYHQVYVDPIRKQRKILLEHYGFEEVPIEGTKFMILVKYF